MNEGLTQKQIGVISMLGFGLTMKEIASAERVSAKAIEHRKENLCRKLKLQCMADIVRVAIGFHLVSL